MEIEATLFNVLVNCYAIKESPSFKFNESGKSVVLDKEATKFMENGLTAAKLITYITLFLEKQMGERIGVNIDKLQTLKVNSNSQAKLYNWNILAKEIEMFGIELTPDEIRSIVEGDHQTIVDLLVQLKDVLHGDVNISALSSKKSTEESAVKEEPKASGSKLFKIKPKGSKPANVVPKAAVDIEEIKTDKNPNECTSWVEYILLTLSQAFKLTPKQAAGFLAKENKFLTEACIKGLKSGYEPIIEWYELVYGSSRHLSNLISEELPDSPNALPLVMKTLQCGISSKSHEVVEWTIKLLSKMSFDFTTFDLHED